MSHNHFKICFTTLMAILWVGAFGQTNTTRFEVELNGKIIGNYFVSEKTENELHIRDIRTVTQTSVISVTVQIETETKVIRKNEKVIRTVAYREANRGPENVKTETYWQKANSYKIVFDQKTTVETDLLIKWCVTDLYFNEPISVSQVYSSMFGKMLQVKKLGQGKYEVPSADGKKIVYHYKDQQLYKIEIFTRIGKVTALRK